MSKSTKNPKKATARTTSIRVLPPADYTNLAGHYQLVRYVLPETLKFNKSKGTWERMHNTLKETIDAVYKVYTYDKMDGKISWALYVLYPRVEEEPPADSCPVLQFEGDELPARELSFDEVELHILVKLLQLAYFRNEENQRRNYFVGQDKCYLYAKRRSPNSDYRICLHMDIRENAQNKGVFHVEGKAQTFARVTDPHPNYIRQTNYFAINEVREWLVTVNEVKSTAVLQTGNLYTIRTFSGNRTTLDFHHAHEDVEQTRGYLLDSFIKTFIDYLKQFGFIVEHISRDFTKYAEGTASDFQLPLDQLRCVHLYDARLNKIRGLEAQVDALISQFPSLSFEWISELDAASQTPVLIFQDALGNAFQEGKPLYQVSDPYETIYRANPKLAKQFLNVNPNEAVAGMSKDDYLEYEPLMPIKEQMQMLLNELFLKDCILQQRQVQNRLPLLPSELIFVHKENRGRGADKQSFEVAMYCQDNRLCFLDLDKSMEDREGLDSLLAAIDMDWDSCYEMMQAYQQKLEGKQELNSYDLIIGRGLILQIAEPLEALLYEYEEILQRVQELNTPQDIDQFKLSPHFDSIMGEAEYSRDWLIMKGYLSEDGQLKVKQGKTQKDREAVELYHRLQAFDVFLDSLKGHYASLSFASLTREPALRQRVEELFDSTRKLRECYNAIGKFKGTRDAEVIPVYQGIWHTEDWHYVVGDVNGMNNVQARANRVRQIIVHKNETGFDIRQILEGMSVKFVRLNQYTVTPYQFHLIDIYIDNVLRYPTDVVSV
jgi:hypothetical protein